ncbi:peptidoglycan editing factor PgeF [Aristophania vespae]|uniref:peptidoglycan editing factor PgeF n=1 Tax=Aristophania vespae TaxID=2697033 RepID=UPI00235163F8|nr:peptidoglycan editing factor PgeF [Aristophania vespae]UMM64110.1 Polyphenol oxidase [Aristophania vespae]
MIKSPAPFKASNLNVRHGFFSRFGGVSTGRYAELNGGATTDDDPAAIKENRRLMAQYFDVTDAKFLALKQVHGREVFVVGDETPLWPLSSLPEADGLVTNVPNLVLTITTADCAPVLFSSGDGKIIGAAHAGWRGAVNGILEETMHQMRSLGATNIKAAIGPCIGPKSYEISANMRDEVLEKHPKAGDFFKALKQERQFMFDLPGFCVQCLTQNGVDSVENLALDTVSDDRFFSYRRSFLAGNSATGRQVSAIQLRNIAL